MHRHDTHTLQSMNSRPLLPASRGVTRWSDWSSSPANNNTPSTVSVLSSQQPEPATTGALQIDCRGAGIPTWCDLHSFTLHSSGGARPSREAGRISSRACAWKVGHPNLSPTSSSDWQRVLRCYCSHRRSHTQVRSPDHALSMFCTTSCTCWMFLPKGADLC